MSGAAPDPYRPPAADLGGMDSPPRPRAVTLATRILYVKYPLGFAVPLVVGFPPAPGAPAWLAPLVAGVTLGLMLGLVFAISRRHRWARIVYAALFALGTIQMFALREMLAEVWAGQPVYFANGVVQTLLDLPALYLLFRPESNAWFRRGR